MEWPDWTGQCAAVVACGPSAKKANPAQLKGLVRVLAIKEAIDLCPFADVVYGCDAPWWRFRRGLPEFKGLKLRWAGNKCDQFADVHPVIIKDSKLDQLLFDKTGKVGSGGNSAFQSLNLAVQFGARRIMLIGFDMHDRSGVHFYGRNNWAGANNPSQDNFRRWIAGFHAASKTLSTMGIEVVNTSLQSDLRCFEHKTVEDTLEAWGLGNIEPASQYLDRVRSAAG